MDVHLTRAELAQLRHRLYLAALASRSNLKAENQIRLAGCILSKAERRTTRPRHHINNLLTEQDIINEIFEQQ